MTLPCPNDRGPAIAEQHQRPRLEHVRLHLVQNQRNLSHGSYAAAQSDVSDRLSNQPLQPFVKMLRWKFFSEIAVRFFVELLHRDTDDAPTAFVRAAACGFHHA